MLSIVFGLIALSLGFWGMIKYWWYMVDVLIALMPMLLLFGGAIALMAGEIASLALSRMTVPIVYFVVNRKRKPV